MKAPCPPNEPLRLAALHRYNILDTPLEAAFDDITRLIAYICKTPIAVVNFIDNERQWFKSEIGLGVRETPLDPSICAHAILQSDLFIIPDTTKDDRFASNPLVTGDPMLRFYAGALLKSSDGYPLGTLCVLDIKPRDLSAEQQDALQILARQVMVLMEMRIALRTEETISTALRTSEAQLADLNRSLETRVRRRTQDLEEAAAKIEASLEEKEVLLREVHHRVKNNLQVVSSLLRMQSNQLTRGPEVSVLRESQNRIRSMSLIHELLYQSQDINRIHFRTYLENVLKHLNDSYDAGSRGIELKLEAEDLQLDLDTAMSCGLIVTELIGNAMKHAFTDTHKGVLRVQLKAGAAQQGVLTVQDNGVGLPTSIDWKKSSSLGFTIVNALARQIKGVLESTPQPQQGVGFTLTFPIPQTKQA